MATMRQPLCSVIERCEAAEFNRAGETVWECSRTDCAIYEVETTSGPAEIVLCPDHRGF